jgi:hypothetical protein
MLPNERHRRGKRSKSGGLVSWMPVYGKASVRSDDPLYCHQSRHFSTSMIHDVPCYLFPHALKRNVRQIRWKNVEHEFRIALSDSIAYAEARR